MAKRGHKRPSTSIPTSPDNIPTLFTTLHHCRLLIPTNLIPAHFPTCATFDVGSVVAAVRGARHLLRNEIIMMYYTRVTIDIDRNELKIAAEHAFVIIINEPPSSSWHTRAFLTTFIFLEWPLELHTRTLRAAQPVEEYIVRIITKSNEEYGPLRISHSATLKFQGVISQLVRRLALF